VSDLSALTDDDRTICAWLEHLSIDSGYSENTVEAYAVDLKLLKRFLTGYSEEPIAIADITRQIVRAWILYRKNKGDNMRSISRGLSAIKSLHGFMLREQLMDSSAILHMKSPKTQKTLPRPMSISHLNDICNGPDLIRKTPWIVKRDISLFVLLYSVGLRIGEALSLNKRDIVGLSEGNRDGGSVVINGKGGKARSVPIMENVLDLLNAYVKMCPFDEEPLFVNRFGDRLHVTSAQKLVKKLVRLLGLPGNITPHSFRHTCATHIMENSGDLRGVQELLGHKSLNSTQIYADITGRYIVETYDKCHPFAIEHNKRKHV
jgi:integrase/recombinase XerC